MSNKRVLVVEDDFVMGMEMRELLEGLDLDVLDVVPSGEEAIEAVKSGNPDLIFMDIRLKGVMTGIDASVIIRDFSSAPVIFLTGYKDTRTAETASVVMNSFYVTKPFNPNELIKIIDRALNKRG